MLSNWNGDQILGEFSWDVCVCVFLLAPKWKIPFNC